MRRWLTDLSLGVRLSVGGGRSGWARLALIADGVGLGVTMLLVAASIPPVLDARTDRAAARSVESGQTLTPGAPTLLTAEVRSVFHDAAINGRLLQPESDDAPLPPGVTRQLAPGDVVLSPALERLLASDDGAALRGRWGDRVVGTIGAEGLAGAGELTFYLGTDRLTDETANRIQSFGGATTPEEGLSPVLMLLALVGIVVLLLPVAIFVSTAVRFGSESRDRRLAAVRLVGADVGATRRIAAGETLAAAVLGLAVGGLLYLAVRQTAGYLVPGNLSFYPADFRPVPALAALVVVLVPVTTVLVTLSALRQVLVEPLGVVRRGSERRRRLWWRLVFPVLGLVLLHPLVTGLDDALGTQVMIVAGLVLLLTGVALVLPWLVEATVRRLGPGGVAWDLAVRRLQLDSDTAVRAVSGIAVSVAGLIALQGLVGAIGALTAGSQADTSTYQASVLDISGGAGADEVWARELAQARGVTAVGTLTSVWAAPDGPSGGSGGADDEGLLIDSGTCEVLAQEAQLDSCADGDVFVVLPDGATAPAPGSEFLLGGSRQGGSDDGGDGAGAGALAPWTLPASAKEVAPPEGGVTALNGGGPPRILVTPGALDGASLEPMSVTTYVALDPAEPDALDHLRTAAAQVDPVAYASPIEQRGISAALGGIRQVLLVGTVALLVMIGASMLVNVVEQLRERRRLLAVLVAFGTRQRTLSGSVLFQVAIPVVLGLALAVVTGSVLALALQVAVQAPLRFDWVGVGTTSGAAALVVLLTTAAGLPLLWRLTRPEGLRSE
ncbi:ABC transporter permease [Promicromonospora sukumoe]|uniref:ABC transporter permease n=1 Tax=Promicromonospora sukumoe TaxID=88382 RepID=UPI000367ABE7|nr:ABC transporter permease [Promicromonospora sukumoe]